MLGPIGLPETLFILVIALLIFGPRRLPELGRTIGKALGEFRRASTELKRSINTEIALEDDEDRPAAPRRPALAGGSAAAASAAEAEGELPEGEEGGQAVWRPPAEPREAAETPLPAPPSADAAAAPAPSPPADPSSSEPAPASGRGGGDGTGAEGSVDDRP